MPDNDSTHTYPPSDPPDTRTAVPDPVSAGTGTYHPDSNGTGTYSPDHPDPLAADEWGSGIPGFEIEGPLGHGGMGMVYRARQTGLNRAVALKMMIPGAFADPNLRTRFLLEAESVAALEHPHIVRVFAFGEHRGHPYLAMELAPGGTLAERIRRDGPLGGDRRRNCS